MSKNLQKGSHREDAFVSSRSRHCTAVEINRLAQRLIEAPLGRSASVAAAAERFERLLAAKIGADRAPKAILPAPGFETAEGRLVAEIDACEPDAPAEPAAPPGCRPRGQGPAG